jgi:nitroreductase
MPSKETLLKEKIAPAEHPIHELMARRFSPLAFSDRPVETAQLLSVLEAGRWAASCFNEQPWSFIVATKDHLVQYQQMLECLMEKNREWAGKAPVLMISVAKLNFDHSGKPNRHAMHDVGQAVANMSLQATSMGLFVHQMAGFDVEKTRRTYEIPATHEPVAAIAVGYGGDPNSLSDHFKQRALSPRSRKKLGDFVFSGQWNKPSDLVAG